MHLSSTQARVRLAKKITERSRLVKQRWQIRKRIRGLTKNLETKETEIFLLEEEIQHLEAYVQDGIGQSSSKGD